MQLSFTDDAVDRLARIAMELNQRLENIGARRLQTVLAQLLDDLLFDAPDGETTEIVIDRGYVDERLSALVKDEDLSRYIL